MGVLEAQDDTGCGQAPPFRPFDNTKCTLSALAATPL